ncbi:unnamed protein product [Heligmosomoides polygyrus]|uniref:Reverse transcriptase domain-containing protein n=1 Tax=Heligmosomoides polygyrus TaxID=6339 RepID=A0A183FBG3_HELPZ|nr:unnamed protein product [Heligmosomoides polygyrus]
MTMILSFYNDIVYDLRREVREEDNISLKLFSATLGNVMRELEWEGTGVKVDDRHLRFADDVVLITPSISQEKRMLADFDLAYGNVGL